MLATLLCSLLPWLSADEAAKSEFTALAKKFETIQSYHFEFAATTTREGGDAPAGGAAGGGAAAGGAAAGGDAKGGDAKGGDAKGGGRGGNSEPWIVDWQRGKPVHLRRSETECFRSEKKVALFDAKKKEWVGLDRQPAGGAKADGDAKAGGAAEGAVAEGEEKARGNQKRVVAEIDQVLFPHVLMKQLGPKVGAVTSSAAGDTVTYVAALDKETAREYAGLRDGAGGKREGGGKGGREGRKEGGGGAKGGDGGAGQAQGKPQGRGEPELDGKLTVIAIKGVVSSVEIEVAVKGAQTRIVRKSMKLSAIDATAVEPPAEAAAALGIQ